MSERSYHGGTSRSREKEVEWLADELHEPLHFSHMHGACVVQWCKYLPDVQSV